MRKKLLWVVTILCVPCAGLFAFDYAQSHLVKTCKHVIYADGDEHMSCRTVWASLLPGWEYKGPARNTD